MAVVAESYLLGVSTRRVDALVKSPGIEGISKSRVSRLAASLDQDVAALRSRPLDAGPDTYVWLDALFIKCRAGGRFVNVAGVIAMAVNAEGHREILGLDVVTSEDGAGWSALLRGSVAGGLSGVARVVSDAHTCAAGALGDSYSVMRSRRSTVAGPETVGPASATPQSGPVPMDPSTVSARRSP